MTKAELYEYLGALRERLVEKQQEEVAALAGQVARLQHAHMAEARQQRLQASRAQTAERGSRGVPWPWVAYWLWAVFSITCALQTLS